jgi:integrase/recombinase XerD
MNPPAQTPSQHRCLPLADWPPADRQDWGAAIAPGDDLLLDDGPGAGLAPRTLQRHRASYGRWLSWLLAQDRLDPARPPGERATRTNIGEYIAALQAENASGTVLVRLRSLAVVLSWLAPERDWTWLRPCLARLAARARPVRDKRARLQPADTLFALGERLMAEAEAKEAAAGSERARAQLYRDGLMTAFLSCHPLRAANFAGLELERQLLPSDAGWWLEIPADETKTRRPISQPLQRRLVPPLEHYLQAWRPRLASPDRVARSRAVWLTREGTAISPNHLHRRITRHTGAAFARPVSPHGFRDAVATTVALTAPERIGIVTPLLGHRSIRTAQRHYNLAGMAGAAKAWHEVLRRIEQG